MYSDLTDGDIIRQVKAIRRWRENNPRAFPRFGAEMLLLRIEADLRGIDIEKESPAIAGGASIVTTSI
jgi:hypothetical protein